MLHAEGLDTDYQRAQQSLGIPIIVRARSEGPPLKTHRSVHRPIYFQQ